MKKLTLFPVLFLLFLLIGIRTKASPGDSCSNPFVIGFNTTGDSISITNSNIWFAYTETGTQVQIVISYPTYAFGHLALDSGSCGTTMDSLGGKILSGTGQDTLFVSNLSRPVTFYVKTYISSGSHSPLGIFSIHLIQSIITSSCSGPPSACEEVSNGGFESYGYCPGPDAFPYPGGTPWYVPMENYSASNVAKLPSSVSCWYSAPFFSSGSGMYYNSCGGSNCTSCVPNNLAGSAGAHSNNGYIGLGLYFEGQRYYINPPKTWFPAQEDREFIVENIPQMIPGATYNVSYWVQLSSYSQDEVTAQGIGIYFGLPPSGGVYSDFTHPQEIEDYTNTPITTSNPNVVTAASPTFTCSPSFNTLNTWVHVTGQYLASGGENCMIMGNFVSGFGDVSSCSAQAGNGSSSSYGSLFGAYYYVDDISVTLSSLPSLIIVSSNSPVCEGTTLDLTCWLGAGATYSWTGPNGFTSSQENPVIVSTTMAAAGTYSLTVGVPGCQTYTATTTVTILPAPTVTVSALNAVLCPGSSGATLTASGASSYSWSPSSGLSSTTGSVITANPLFTHTYTVTGTGSNGCLGYANVTVTQDNNLSVSIASVGSTCAGTPVNSIVLGGASPYIYSWNPGGQTTANISTLATGTYTLTVTDNDGCTATSSTTYTVDPDCCYLSASCTNPAVIASGSSSSPYTFSNNPCINIKGPGTFTISGSFTITNCDIAMGDGATIDVPSGATLTIDNSRLYACGDMWQGIKVEAGGTLYINGSSATSPCIIEDAIDGIQMQGSAYITYGLLNNNLYDIYISQSAPDNGTAYLSLRSSVLTCQSDPGYSNNAYLKYPNLGSITNSGVYITNLGARNSIQVGDYTSSSYQNTFSNMNYGVNVTSSSFAVCNDNFEYLYGNDGQCIPSIFPFVTYAHCPSPVGIAVFANNPDLAYEYFESNLYFYQAIVGGTSSNQGNIMHECYRGVDMTNYSFPDVIDNTITNTANAYSTPTVAVYPYGDHGIYLKDLDNPLVTGNTITNFYTGIHLNDYALTGEGTYNNIGYVTGNVVSASGTSTGIMNFGIIAELLMEPNGPAVPLFIDGNSVSEASSSCVLINSVDCPLPYYDLSVDTNNLAILPSTSRTEGTQKSGIYLASAQNCIIYNNTISSSGTYIGSSPSGRADTSVIGIRSVLSQAIHECNNISNVGECMMFEGLNFPSSIDNNYMGSAYNGLVLESSGYIGKQGSATDPIGDIWQGPFSNYYTFTLNSWASYSPLYVLNSATENPAYSAANNATSNYLTGDFYIYNTNVFPATGTVPACPTGCISCKAPTRSQYQPLAQKIVDDSVPYSVFIDESKYISQQAVFTQISEDTTLMDSSTILHSFYTTTSSSTAPNNIGVLYTISADIANKNYTTAQSLNNSFTPVNLIEQNQQLVNYVYLHTLGAGIDTINKPQFDTLVGIATQCPLEGGTAVFESRSLLNRLLNTNYVFTDSCLNDSSSGHAAHRRPTTVESAIASNINTKVYPNPANTMLNIQVNLIQGQIAYFVMYNSLGEEIKSMELDNQLTTLPTNNLSAGMYYYRIIDKNGNTIKADKQLLMH